MTPAASSRINPSVLAELRARMAADAPRREKTRQAAALLFFEHGIYPSAKVVLEYTQQGSLTDINRDLREFWQELREKARVQIDVPSLPQELLQGFGENLAALWELAVARAQEELEGLRAEATAQAQRATLEARESDRLRRLAEDEVDAREAELRQERERREAAERRGEAQGAEIDGLRASLAQWQQQAEKEATARSDAEQQFSRDLEAERTLRQQEAERHAGEARYAKMHIEQARASERDLREQLKLVSASKDVELATYRQRAGRAEEELVSLRLELAELRGRALALETKAASGKSRESVKDRPLRPLRRQTDRAAKRRRSLR